MEFNLVWVTVILYVARSILCYARDRLGDVGVNLHTLVLEASRQSLQHNLWDAKLYISVKLKHIRILSRLKFNLHIFF